MSARVPASVIICTTVVAIIEILAVAGLIATGADADRLIGFLATINALAVPALYALTKAEQNNTQIADTRKRVEQVNAKVNGHLTELANRAGLDNYDPETDPPNIPDL